mgnify:CR=1 FL=1
MPDGISAIYTGDELPRWISAKTVPSGVFLWISIML